MFLRTYTNSNKVFKLGEMLKEGLTIAATMTHECPRPSEDLNPALLSSSLRNLPTILHGLMCCFYLLSSHIQLVVTLIQIST